MTEASPRTILGLGIIVLVVLSLGAGFWWGAASRGSHTVVETQVMRIPVTDIETVTVAPPAPKIQMSDQCKKVVDALPGLIAGVRELSAGDAALQQYIDKLAKSVYTKDPNEVVHLTDELYAIQSKRRDAWAKTGPADADITANLSECHP